MGNEVGKDVERNPAKTSNGPREAKNAKPPAENSGNEPFLDDADDEPCDDDSIEKKQLTDEDKEMMQRILQRRRAKKAAEKQKNASKEAQSTIVSSPSKAQSIVAATSSPPKAVRLGPNGPLTKEKIERTVAIMEALKKSKDSVNSTSVETTSQKRSAIVVDAGAPAVQDPGPSQAKNKKARTDTTSKKFGDDVAVVDASAPADQDQQPRDDHT